MSTMHATSKLDDLIVTTIDSVRGYEQAAEHADAGGHADFFRSMAAERRAIVEMLQAEVTRLGGTPNDFGSLAGTVFRRWEDLRHALGGGEKALAESVRRGEDYLKEEFDRVVKDDKLSPETALVVQDAYASVLRGHQQAEARLHAEQAA
jgi:uncharacterized protein (TIGR02284 family)